MLAQTSVTDALRQLGGQIRQWRETQPGLSIDEAAQRLGVSRGTWLRMERGAPGVRIEAWLAAFRLMGTIDEVLRASEPNLFDLVVDHYYPGFG
jgi:transcriptional regulator with XRE-family HTH domain